MLENASLSGHTIFQIRHIFTNRFFIARKITYWPFFMKDWTRTIFLKQALHFFLFL